MLLVLPGCLASPFFKNLTSFFNPENEDGIYTDRKNSVKIIPLRIPESGERLSIHDPETGRELNVTIGEVYTAASGKLCGRYTLESENSSRQSGLVCFERQEDWIKVPLQLPGNF